MFSLLIRKLGLTVISGGHEYSRWIWKTQQNLVEICSLNVTYVSHPIHFNVILIMSLHIPQEKKGCFSVRI